MKTQRMALGVAAGLLALSVAGVAVGDTYGEEAFGQYCATCHGGGGAGDGPLTAHMEVSVPDLTTLARRNDGAFPMLEVIHIIDGRTGLRAHGGPMPVYGALFAEDASDFGIYGAALQARGRVLSIAYYLETIQQE